MGLQKVKQFISCSSNRFTHSLGVAHIPLQSACFLIIRVGFIDTLKQIRLHFWYCSPGRGFGAPARRMRSSCQVREKRWQPPGIGLLGSLWQCEHRTWYKWGHGSEGLITRKFRVLAKHSWRRKLQSFSACSIYSLTKSFMLVSIVRRQ